MTMGTAKFQVHSDLHTEFSDLDIPNLGADALILAGDIGTFGGKTHLPEWLRKICGNFDKVLMLPGNHEYYGSSIEKVESQLSTLEIPGFVYMQENTHEVNGVVVAGCTLWTDLDRGNMSVIGECMQDMNDYYSIKSAGRVLSPYHTMHLHKQHLDFLNGLGSSVDVVMTHHLPTMQSHDARSHGDGLLKWAYGSNIDWLIDKMKPRVWIHGHTHHCVSYPHKVSDVHILSNARGYQAQGYEEVTGWELEQIIEVTSKNNSKGESDEVST